jgi:hypothetical protein
MMIMALPLNQILVVEESIVDISYKPFITLLVKLLVPFIFQNKRNLSILNKLSRLHQMTIEAINGTQQGRSTIISDSK